MEGVIKEISFKDEKPWKDIIFYNYNVLMDDIEKGELKGIISSANKKSTIGVGDRVRYEIKETQFGLKFDKPNIVPVPVPEMFKTKEEAGPKPSPKEDPALRIEALSWSVKYWEGRSSKTPEKIVETAKTFVEFLKG